MSYHTIIIAGNVGQDAELRYTPAGKAVANFPVAANHQYTNSQGDQVKETTWFRVSTWEKLADICNQYVKKGMKVLVEGRLIADPTTGGPRTYTGSQGETRTSFEVVANTVRFLSRSEGTTQETEAPINEEDLPF